MKRGSVYNAAAAPALRSVLNDPSSKELSPEAISIGLVAAVLAFSPISAADMDAFIEHLPDFVRDIRAWYDIGVRRS